MSMRPIDRSAIPEKTAELGRKLLGQNSRYRLIGDLLGDLVKDEDFADMYSSLGGSALSPALLSRVLIFQMLEKLPDRLMTKAVRVRIDWKYALHLPLDWIGFHFTNLSHFRERLLRNEAEYRIFERLLEKIVEMGFIAAAWQTTDGFDECSWGDSQTQSIGNGVGNVANGIARHPVSRCGVVRSNRSRGLFETIRRPATRLRLEGRANHCCFAPSWG